MADTLDRQFIEHWSVRKKHERMQNLSRKFDAVRLPLKTFSLNKDLSLRDQVRIEFPLIPHNIVHAVTLLRRKDVQKNCLVRLAANNAEDALQGFAQ